ncbi:hypothetical protein ACWEKT_03370 [Nocardia takedensis]
MTDLESVPASPEVSTALCRAAGRLQTVLPPGWSVEVAMEPGEPGERCEPILRVCDPGQH